jgi:hypothetical protein
VVVVVGATRITESLPIEDLGVPELPQLVLYHLQLEDDKRVPLTYRYTLCPLQMVLLGELELILVGPQMATVTVTETQTVLLQRPSALTK